MNQQEAKNKIELEAIAAVENAMAKRFTYPESYCELYEQGAYFIFNLLSKEISEKDEEIKRLNSLIGVAHSEGYDDAFYHIEYSKSWKEFKADNNLHEEVKKAVHCIGCGCSIAEGNEYCGECLCEDDSDYL